MTCRLILKKTSLVAISESLSRTHPNLTNIEPVSLSFSSNYKYAYLTLVANLYNIRLV